ncbi:MAG: hypothetical protein LBD19_00830 [Endomicrobium sp.]|jgi:IS30 family transposase|nr:hypothetical protein [Endomicrobium sp.]
MKPDCIAGRLKYYLYKDNKDMHISRGCIYAWIKENKLTYYLDKGNKKYKPKKKTEKKQKIPNRTSIHERPEGANNRQEFAHF